MESVNLTDDRFDAVIIGAGHNGLTCAAYLARSGMSVKVVERRSVVGGAAVTEEFYPGFKNSTCAYTVGLLNSKVLEDLQLSRHGLSVVERPLSNFLPLEDGNFLRLYSDYEKMHDEVARFSIKDAEQISDYFDTIERLAHVLRKLVLKTPPNVGGGLLDLLRAYQHGRLLSSLNIEIQRDLADILSMSAVDFLSRWFENDTVKTLFAFDGIVGTMASPYSPGTAYVLLHHCFGQVNGRSGVWGHPMGGMGAVSNAIASAAIESGVKIEVSTSVEKIVIKNGEVTGVQLKDGRIVEAKVVVSNVNPKLLFSDLVESDVLEPNFLKRISSINCGSGVFRMNVALSELPNFSCMLKSEEIDYLSSGIIIAPSLEYMDKAFIDTRSRGWSHRPIIEILIPSTLDQSLAPPGKHVASLFCQYFNPNLPNGENWDDIREQVASEIIQTVDFFAPNFSDAVIGRQILSPLDLEREFGLIGGDIFHGALDLNQLYTLRPVLGYASYRMPIKGLYLCGAGAHPGGGVSGIPGHNAAREIIKDFFPYRATLGLIR